MLLRSEKRKVQMIPLGQIVPNPNQPRVCWREEELEELCSSIRQAGVLQPITVRREKNGYELIAGERRLRAAGMAGLTEIPALVLPCTVEESASYALIENIQRQDLDFFEEAAAFSQLCRQQAITQEELARRLGKSQAYVANKMRLLRFSQEEQQSMRDHGLSERHARALLRVEDADIRVKLLQTVIRKKMTVRETEALVEKYAAPPKRKTKPRFFVKDVRLFLNTINHAIEVMQQAGVRAQADRRETEQYFEYIVRIPK